MKRNSILALALVALWSGTAAAQGGIDRVLAEIAAHSTALDVLDKTAAAQQAAAHTGLTLPAPEAGFNYLFGSEAGMGRRRDYSVSQSFDVPTLSGAKRRLAASRDSVAASQRDEGRTALLLEAKRQCIAVVYENQRLALLERRRRDVGRLSGLIAASVARGEATALDENNARLTLATLDVDMAESRAARTAALAELARMNGGRPVSLADTAVELVACDVNLNLLRNALLVGGEQVEFLLIDVVHSLELGSLIDWPRQGAHLYFKFLLKLVKQVEGVAPFAVHLVDEDDYRRVAHAAYVHQLARLRLHALRPVHHDDGRVYGGKRAVSVFGEVLVARRIKYVDLVALVVKLHDRC